MCDTYTINKRHIDSCCHIIHWWSWYYHMHTGIIDKPTSKHHARIIVTSWLLQHPTSSDIQFFLALELIPFPYTAPSSVREWCHPSKSVCIIGDQPPSRFPPTSTPPARRSALSSSNQSRLHYLQWLTCWYTTKALHQNQSWGINPPRCWLLLLNLPPQKQASTCQCPPTLKRQIQSADLPNHQTLPK